MSASLTQLQVPLSRLVPSRRNPRKVKPAPQSHESLVALIKAYGLLQPLVVRPLEGKAKHYEVVAGHRRLKALKEIHHKDGDPKIPCVLHEMDTVTADAVSLGENFGREAMHPLDEAEAFARLATEEAKGIEAIASDFGVSDRYVKQRMKLAGLAEIVKHAYRNGEINTAIAEAFASVPMERQEQVWQELNGHPRHADHVRNVIARAWIDSTLALFDVASLPTSAVASDLFSEQVLIEREACLAAQTQALGAQRNKLLEEGWREVIVGRYEDLQDRLATLDSAPSEFDEPTMRRLEKLAERSEKLQAKLNETPDEQEQAIAALNAKLNDVYTEQRQIEQEAIPVYSEATKANGTVFLLLCSHGEVRTEYRIPRTRSNRISASGPQTAADGQRPTPVLPTSDELSDRQRAVSFTHQALAVRQAALASDAVRNRLLAMVLHEKIRSDALSVRHEANSTSVCAGGENFTSSIYAEMQKLRAKLDPFGDQSFVEDIDAYERLAKLSGPKLESLISVLAVDCLEAHLQRRTEFVCHLAAELKVNIRDHWRPDETWLSCFQKAQLAHLIVELLGPVHQPAPERKKSELVQMLAGLFSDAAAGTLEDKKLAERLNAWLPSNLREIESDAEPTARRRPSAT